MTRTLLTEEEFARIVASRAREQWPAMRFKSMGKSLLLMEIEPGRRRLLSLAALYQLYCESPLERDEVISHFLASLSVERPARVQGSFADNKSKVMPQVVPPSLIDYCRQDNRELAAITYVGSLSIAFVLDEPERYAYLHRAAMEQWAADETELLTAAVANLEVLDQAGEPFHQIGLDDHLILAWESFDGYDASRILLTRRLLEAAARVPGNPVIAIPHRDYMVMFGDADPEWVEEMSDRIREEFENHGFPITPELFTLKNGTLAIYRREERQERLIN